MWRTNGFSDSSTRTQTSTVNHLCSPGHSHTVPNVLEARHEYVSSLTATGTLGEPLTELVYATVATAVDCD